MRRGFSYTFTFGIYSQKHGSYGRHNREYVPYEVRQLGECSGIETDLLFTEDVYPLRRDSREIKEFLSQSKDDPKMQGQTILYRWIKFTDEFNKSGSSKFSMLFTEPENLNPFYAKDLQVSKSNNKIAKGANPYVVIVLALCLRFVAY